MTFSKIILAGVTALSVSLATACTANSAEVKAAKANNQANNYVKPGASISYSHNLKSQLSAGETAVFKLTLGESYDEGQLTVNVTAEGDISLFASSTQARFDMASGTSHDMDISVTANTNGRHYINVDAWAESPSGESQPRIFSIPVQVGPVTKQKPNAGLKTLENGENIIEMEAQEEIK